MLTADPRIVFLLRQAGATLELASKSSIVRPESANFCIGGNISMIPCLRWENDGIGRLERYLSSLGRLMGKAFRENTTVAGTGVWGGKR